MLPILGTTQKVTVRSVAYNIADFKILKLAVDYFSFANKLGYNIWVVRIYYARLHMKWGRSLKIGAF